MARKAEAELDDRRERARLLQDVVADVRKKLEDGRAAFSAPGAAKKELRDMPKHLAYARAQLTKSDAGAQAALDGSLPGALTALLAAVSGYGRDARAAGEAAVEEQRALTEAKERRLEGRAALERLKLSATVRAAELAEDERVAIAIMDAEARKRAADDALSGARRVAEAALGALGAILEAGAPWAAEAFSSSASGLGDAVAGVCADLQQGEERVEVPLVGGVPLREALRAQST